MDFLPMVLNIILEDGTIQFYTQVGVIDQDYDWIWTTKDGKKLFVKDMDTNHIKNCIKMICRNNPTISCFTAMIKELIKRGEI